MYPIKTLSFIVVINVFFSLKVYAPADTILEVLAIRDQCRIEIRRFFPGATTHENARLAIEYYTTETRFSTHARNYYNHIGLNLETGNIEAPRYFCSRRYNPGYCVGVIANIFTENVMVALHYAYNSTNRRLMETLRETIDDHILMYFELISLRFGVNDELIKTPAEFCESNFPFTEELRAEDHIDPEERDLLERFTTSVLITGRD